MTVNSTTTEIHDEKCQKLAQEEQYTEIPVTPEVIWVPPYFPNDDKQKILGTLWDSDEGSFIIDIKVAGNLVQDVQARKRNVISVSSKIYDSMGFISPTTVNLKLLF